MKNRCGSITVYLCLTLTILISLFSAMLQSARTAGGRVMIASAMEQGLFSLFGQYDRQLLEDYDLFYINGGYGSTSLQMDNLYHILYRDVVNSLDPEGSANSSAWNLFDIDFTSGSITGYTLASDQAGNSFEAQVAGYMKQKLSVSGIQQLSENLAKKTQQITMQDYERIQIAETDPIAIYDLEIENAKNNSKSATDSEQTDSPEQTGDTASTATTPTVTENPIEVIKKIRKMGILSLVVPDMSTLSDTDMDSTTLPSNRQLQQGLNLVAKDDHSITDKVLMAEYILEKFPCFTSEATSNILAYQVEYVIGQKNSDIENLKSVVTRLLAIREAANLVYLYSNPAKKAQADALASTLAIAFMLPVAEPVIALAILAAWAFAESILDIRELLDGGKVPLQKDDNSWMLSLEHLPELLTHLDDDRKDSETGFDYQWYLRFLLYLDSSEDLTSSAMNLVEYNMNQKYPDYNFRIDNCIDQLEAESHWSLNNHSYSICRNYQYLSP